MILTRKQRQSGFSLVELIVVMAILTIISGVIFRQIDDVQRRFHSEENKLDIIQTAREFIDQMVRDIHQAGFPNAKMYQNGSLAAPLSQRDLVGVGIVFISPTQVRFEGDIDGDGIVDAVAYRLFPQSATPGDANCPCLRRSQVRKADGVDPSAQATDYKTQVENISATNITIFTAYDRDGVPIDVTGGLTKMNFDPYDTTDPVNRIFTVQISLNVRSATAEFGLNQRPQAFLTATAQVNN